MAAVENAAHDSTPGADKPNDTAEQQTAVDMNRPDAASTRAKGRRKKKTFARPPPFSERDIGHVVFRGNEQLE